MPADQSFLAEVPLFATLDEDDRRVLASGASIRTLAAGEILFRIGDPGNELFVVQAGAIELFATDTTGQKIVFQNATRGDTFGELSLLDHGPRTASAVATEPSELIGVDHEDLLQLFKKRPESALHLLATVGAMARRSGALLRQHGVRNVNTEIEVQSSRMVRITDAIAAFSGGMPFFVGNLVVFAWWIAWNIAPWSLRFDPYPFGMLTTAVSLEAILLSCLVLLSQSRQSEKDRVRADIEYDVNIRAEQEVAQLHIKADRIHEEMLAQFNRLEKDLRTHR